MSMRDFAKQILVIVLLITFSIPAKADCAPKYLKEMQRLSVKVDKVKKVNKVVSGTIGGTFTAFWGTMGVIMVGPAGVLIGLQFGLAAAAPTALTFFAVNKVNKVKFKNHFKALSIIQAAKDSPDTDKAHLKALHQTLLKKDPGLTLEDLKHEITSLNHQQAFCDGSIKKKLMGYKAIKKFLKKRYDHLAKSKKKAKTELI